MSAIGLCHGGPAFCRWGAVLFKRGQYVIARVSDKALVTTFNWGKARIHTYETPVDAMRGVTRLMLEGKINRRRKYAIVRMCQKNWSPAERLDRIPGTLRHTGKPIGNIFFYDYLSEGKTGIVLDQKTLPTSARNSKKRIKRTC